MTSLKKKIKKILPDKIFYWLRDAVYPEKIGVIEDRVRSLFLTHYRDLASPTASQKIALRNAEFKVYSKHGMDGLLLYIFSKIGITNRNFIEIGVEDGRECNTANLALNFGWGGLLVDANEAWVKSAAEYFEGRLGATGSAVTVTASFVTAENIDSLVANHSIKDTIDLLSIDINGNDYWVWKSIKSVQPRVVVVEYNAAFGQKPITIAYNPDHQYDKIYKDYPLYWGASIAAFTKLAKEKGYILVACDSHGHDAIFIRKDATQGKFIELAPSEAFYPNPLNLIVFGSIESQFDQIKHLDFAEV